MGVYCFRWKRGPWLKVGHYHKENPWSRIARRGWASVSVPDPAIHFSNATDFDLLFWSPALGRKHEARVHRMFPDRFGEWIGRDKEIEVVRALLALGHPDEGAGCSLDEALASKRRL